MSIEITINKDGVKAELCDLVLEKGKTYRVQDTEYYRKLAKEKLVSLEVEVSSDSSLDDNGGETNH